MIQHINIVHKGLKEFKCELCNKDFTRSQNLHTHIKNVHKGGENKENFDQSQNNLKRKKIGDNQSHNNESEKNAENPKKNLPVDLNNTEKTSAEVYGKETFSCNSCDKNYKHSESLQRHTNVVHKGIKAFACKVCDENFPYSHVLKNHIKKVHENNIAPPEIKKRKAEDVASETKVEQKIEMEEEPEFESEEEPEVEPKVEPKVEMKVEPQDEKPEVEPKVEMKIETKVEPKDESEVGLNSADSKSNVSNTEKDQKISALYNPTRFACQSCEKSFSRHGNFKNHMKKEHENNIAPPETKKRKVEERSTEPEVKTKVETEVEPKHELRVEMKEVTTDIDQDEPMQLVAPTEIEEQNEHEGVNSPAVEEFSFTPEQIDQLEDFFRTKQYINIFEIEQFATTGTYPNYAKVQQWFAKRREEIGNV